MLYFIFICIFCTQNLLANVDIKAPRESNLGNCVTSSNSKDCYFCNNNCASCMYVTDMHVLMHNLLSTVNFSIGQEKMLLILAELVYFLDKLDGYTLEKNILLERVDILINFIKNRELKHILQLNKLEKEFECN